MHAKPSKGASFCSIILAEPIAMSLPRTRSTTHTKFSYTVSQLIANYL